MNNFYATFNQLANSTFEFISDVVQKGGVLGGRAIEYAKTLPEQMQKDSNTAVKIFLVANLASLGIATLFSRFLENLSDRSDGPRLGSSRNSFKNIAIRFIIIGGAVAGSNLLLSKITEYALSNAALTAITGTQVALGLLMKDAEGKALAKKEAEAKREADAKREAEAKRLRQEKAKEIVVPNFEFKIHKLSSEQTKFIITCKDEMDLNNFFEILEWGTHIKHHCYMERESSKLQFTLRMKTDKDTSQNQSLIERNLNNLRSKSGQTVTPKKDNK